MGDLISSLIQKIIGNQPKLANPYISSGNIPSSPTLSPSMSPDQVKQGFLNFNSNSPLATQSGVISQSLASLSPKIDPKLVLGIALKETRGGADLQNSDRATNGVNNNWNVKPSGHLVNYPDLQTALLGGSNPLENHSSKGLINLLNSPTYQKYQQTGDPADFFNVYSPPGSGNPPIDTQVQQIQSLMKNWK
jgi:hypothetical protein